MGLERERERERGEMNRKANANWGGKKIKSEKGGGTKNKI